MGRRAGRQALTADRIYAAALKVVDEHGLDALSMRRLGTELGVDAMAVYHHVPGKDALLHGLVRQVFAGMDVPAARGPWTGRVRQWAQAYRAVARAHPNLVLRIVTDPGAVAAAAVLANETLYRALEQSGLKPADVARAADLVVDYVNGHVLGAAEGVMPEAVAAFRAELEAQPPEAVAAQLRVFGRAGDGQRNNFEFGLDVLLKGLQRVAEG